MLKSRAEFVWKTFNSAEIVELKCKSNPNSRCFDNFMESIANCRNATFLELACLLEITFGNPTHDRVIQKGIQVGINFMARLSVVSIALSWTTFSLLHFSTE